MALRKEEERKQLHSKTGGGVFNLIFRRGKSSQGSGSISSENRSISPTHSDDSRSLTPPNPPQAVAPPPKKEQPLENPKPPQRKRRPAPKPPGPTEGSRRNSEEKPPSSVSESSEVPQQMEPATVRKSENGLTICHSRNSSDSSGYHEASVLSENCNTSLPRRPKSAFVTAAEADKLSKLHSHSTTNLTKMTAHSKSTTSLAIAGRKKKAAPPPPPLVRASNPAINIETPSPVVASQSIHTPKDSPAPQETIFTLPNPSPTPRSKSKAPPQPVPRKLRHDSRPSSLEQEKDFEVAMKTLEGVSITKSNITIAVEDINCLETLSPPVQADIKDHSQNEDIFINQDEHNSLEKEISNKNRNSDFSDDGFLHTRLTSKVGKVDNEAIIDELIKELRIENHSNEAVTQSDEIIHRQDINNNNQAVFKINSASKEETSQYIAEKENDAVMLGELQTLAAKDILKSSEFSVKRPPEVVALIPKTQNANESLPRTDSLGGLQFQIGPQGTYSLKDPAFVDKGSSHDFPVSSPSIPLKSYDSITQPSDDEDGTFEYENFDSYNQFHEKNYRRKKISVTSLRSTSSMSDLVGGNGLRKWNNIEDLDHNSLTSLGPNNKWVVGDFFGPESLDSQQALESLASLSIGDSVNHENKCFGSTDSGIAQETVEKISEPDDVPSISPPPPPLFAEQPEPSTEVTSNSTVISDQSDVLPAPEHFAQEVKEEIFLERQCTDSSPISLSKDISLPVGKADIYSEINNQEPEIGEIDWHYQLPSPPKAFRDLSPVAFASSESQSLTDFKDSVVTSPELFEKLKNIEDIQSEKETVSSDLTSIVSEEEKPPLLNTLSLENLEKRKSLVYNRVLATSLKMTDNDIVDNVNEAETFSSSITKFESAFSEIQNSSQIKTTSETKFVKKSNIGTHTLPNFKISAYDKPKQRIKVFEDDTIRSNTDYINKENTHVTESVVDTSFSTNSSYGETTEDMSKRKNSINNQSSYSNEEKEYHFYKPEGRPPKSAGIVLNISRSGSFSRDSVWPPIKPVSRSKSHLTLNSNKVRETTKDEGISRSNSLYDGLQSLGVMRLIQNKLNTPTSSMENIAGQYKNESTKLVADVNIKSEISDKEKSASAPEKPYKYCGPPSVNMSTWSERPKMPVAVKEDADYKLGNNNMSSKLIVNTTNNSIISSNVIEVRNKSKNSATINVNGFERKQTNGINIKVNSSDTVNNNPARNVVIKIGSEQPKVLDNQRFISHTTAVGYRKPFNTISSNQRPHSIAFDSDFDISRVPVVRSVELKKRFNDINNTSVTEINQYKQITKEPVSELMNKFSTMNRSTETLSNKAYLSQSNEDKESKPVFRANSMRPQIAPVVRGFNSMNMQDNKISNRLSWTTSNTYNTLPNKGKEKDDFSTNKHVPFSQSNLRRTESSKIVDKNIYNKEKEDRCGHLVIDTNSYHSLPACDQEFKPPPPPPSMAKLKPVRRIPEPVSDPRDQLMSAIRNFGGKKGLKSAKS